MLEDHLDMGSCGLMSGVGTFIIYTYPPPPNFIPCEFTARHRDNISWIMTSFSAAAKLLFSLVSPFINLAANQCLKKKKSSRCKLSSCFGSMWLYWYSSMVCSTIYALQFANHRPKGKRDSERGFLDHFICSKWISISCHVISESLNIPFSAWTLEMTKGLQSSGWNMRPGRSVIRVTS